MKLYIVNSNSHGNGYLLEATDGEQLLIEAGRPLKEFSKYGNLKRSRARGMLISHEHGQLTKGDHCKYAKDFIKAGIDVYSCNSVADKIPGVNRVKEGETYNIGKFRVTPFEVKHDCEDYGYIIYHPEYGSIFFASDCYNLRNAIRGCKCYLMECNYEDGLLDKAVAEGKTARSQADRVRLSHMSLAHSIEYLNECYAANSANQIILIHGSARHLNPIIAVNKFQQVIGVPTYYAKSGEIINLI